MLLRAHPASGANYFATEVEVFGAGPRLIQRLDPPSPAKSDNAFGRISRFFSAPPICASWSEIAGAMSK